MIKFPKSFWTHQKNWQSMNLFILMFITWNFVHVEMISLFHVSYKYVQFQFRICRLSSLSWNKTQFPIKPLSIKPTIIKPQKSNENQRLVWNQKFRRRFIIVLAPKVEILRCSRNFQVENFRQSNAYFYNINEGFLQIWSKISKSGWDNRSVAYKGAPRRGWGPMSRFIYPS